MQKFFSNGKLLLSGEYLILDGAMGLALPTVLGQELTVRSGEQSGLLTWQSFDEKGVMWFEANFGLPNLNIIDFIGDQQVATTLQRILLQARKANASFLNDQQSMHASATLQFPRIWGLGSSSTLINNIAQWAGINPYDLLFKSFGGSGYDIACAGSEKALLYQLLSGIPKVKQVNFNPVFKDHLFFVHLNRKQVSSKSIRSYQKKTKDPKKVAAISAISQKLLSVADQQDFNQLLKQHEDILSQVLNTLPVQQHLFPDFEGQIKSLGAWGGDFVLVSGDKTSPTYFREKGFNTVIPYASMIKTS